MILQANLTLFPEERPAVMVVGHERLRNAFSHELTSRLLRLREQAVG